MYFHLHDVTSLINNDDAITEISYKVDLSRKNCVDKLSEINLLLACIFQIK